jgi:hypothetical protein
VYRPAGSKDFKNASASVDKKQKKLNRIFPAASGKKPRTIRVKKNKILGSSIKSGDGDKGKYWFNPYLVEKPMKVEVEGELKRANSKISTGNSTHGSTQ